MSEFHNCSESSSDLQLPEKQTTPTGSKKDHQVDSPGISGYTTLKKYLLVGRETGSILQDSEKCVLHVSKVNLETFVNSALFRFLKGLVLRNTIQ
jgi:hypothetical protein